MAVTGTFTNGVLSVIGDNLGNTITISRNAAGQLLINGGAVAITGGTPTVANTSLVQVFSQGDNDVVTFDEALGALPRVNHFGGTGNDTLTGGSGNDQLFGQSGNDVLLGKGGSDFLFGGADNDVLTGGDADDQMFGEDGDDRLIWNPGDDTDLHEGGAGIDTTEVNGGGGREIFTATANGTRVRFDRLDPAPFSIDMGTMEKLVVNMNGGDDEFSATGNLAALIQITVDGGTGNDRILGGNGIDTLLGGEGNDFIDGQQGNDVALLGAGHDIFQWDPGDGSDVVEGQDGSDTMLFNGSAGNEIFALSANGARALFTRNLGNIVMDLNDLEIVELNALGGTDTLTVNDMTGTDILEVKVNLAGVIGGTAGDAAADIVTVTGRNANDAITVTGAGTAFNVTGVAAQVSVTNSEGANDALVVNALGGDDTITATALPAGVVTLTIDGGAGNDTINGSQGADTVLGGDGNDFVFGDNGNDLALMGAGADVFQWNPGDGNDTIEGQAGTDTMLFFGANIAESIDITANGGRVRFNRDVANVTMDTDDVESIDFRALGGADNIVVGDLSGTDATLIGIDLRGPNGGGDGAADTVTVNGSQADNTITVAGNAGGVSVSGLQAQVNMLSPEAANDRLVVNGLGGDDVINASSLAADGMQLTLNGGLGDDLLIGSQGGDLFNGGDGNDVALMGAGDDLFVWNPGDDNDTLEGQAGKDTLLFNGSNAAEQVTISANGGRALLLRDIANVLMDMNDVETLQFNALGGADRIVVNDMSGTDLQQVRINLSGVLNGTTTDAAADSVTVQGTAGNDVITLSLRNGSLVVSGLATEVVIDNFEIDNDRITINGLGGNDVIDASQINAAALQLTVDAGDGNDIVVGGNGADTLAGGAGNDVLLGGPGTDVLDGGTGDNIVIQGGSGTFSAQAVATQTGNAGDDQLVVSRNAAGQILFNGAPAGSASVANTALVRAFGLEGNDTLTFNEADGALPAGALYGGGGNDAVTGGAGGDLLFGGDGSDTVLGKGGDDQLYAGDGNDVLTGGDGDDQMFGEAGDDRLIWNPGDDTDLHEGGAGIDTTEVNGGGGREIFTATANGTRVRFDRLDPAPFSIDMGTMEKLVVNMNGGDDEFSATGNLSALIQMIVDGGAGNDRILGGNGIDTLLGGDGNDFIDGNQGNDVAFLGAGDDRFVWNPGDGSDVVEGQAGFDILQFDGSAASENFEVLANGGRHRLTRDVGNITMDSDDVETIEINALGGADTIRVRDLAGTDVQRVRIDLAAAGGGGDGQADTVVVDGTNGNDTVVVIMQADGTVVLRSGGKLINIKGFEADRDRLVFEGLGGNDTVDASRLPAGAIQLVLNGGDGDDRLTGGGGNDVLDGGAGFDHLIGGPGVDVLLNGEVSIEGLGPAAAIGFAAGLLGG
ncbi:beta strand repeat-containing protein [Pseudaquabacterium terrae]|uniref:beta strand repeat-containing protein n=1 Tax=Pseudaquabacterium terrae TaxID=2732868 RepID=UPI001C26411A|nr:calcium-binding protein [Aquabacterium terrae]